MFKLRYLENLLDDFYNGLENRFNQETLNLISAIGRIIELRTEEFDIELLLRKFVLNSDELKGELRLLRSLPDFLEPSNKTIHQWLGTALKLFTTIPVTRCSCERAFSKLCLVKLKLRSRMLQERLDAMMLIFIEQEL
ncbi:Zinc finger MYM-type protein 1 [Aphis craccivora]|uniref:Zinc finger MYM-type protein 1 n=1 Tax=Aphis craccivora TaxID=307492 RepID=A0A6G0Z694_APHCR|nr:Zinc finger MYM-type protein 1 [Aphis craccivora]